MFYYATLEKLDIGLKLVRYRGWRPLPPFLSPRTSRLSFASQLKSTGSEFHTNSLSIHSLVQSVGKSFVRSIRDIYSKRLSPNPVSLRRGVRNLEALRNVKESGGEAWSIGQRTVSLSALPTSSSSRFSSLASVSRTFVNGILNRITNTQILRKKVAQNLLHGRSAPFLALVGVSLASGNGVMNKETEVEYVCSQIRHTSAKIRLSSEKAEDLVTSDESEVSLRNFRLGDIIAKGCNAVVVAAEWTEKRWDDISNAFQNMESIIEMEGAPKPGPSTSNPKSESLAIKMMFNYEAESNADSIFNAMYNEIVPARSTPFLGNGIWGLDNRKHLPAHPNIVKMHTVFADYIPDIKGSDKQFPDALPKRLNANGFGRNMSLFMVMKRYDMNLNDYLRQYGREISPKTSLFIFTQLLEGLAHLSNHDIAHRDLKADNILIDISGGFNYPSIVITDFGCCLADNKNGLKFHYTSSCLSRGGNRALMAPEVISAVPGLFSFIDYSKSDLWAAGSIGYEIFGTSNPFYVTDKNKKIILNSSTYKAEDLPDLSNQTSLVINNLIHNLLERNPRYRMTSELAATICQLILWAPKSWFHQSTSCPKSQEILQWLLTLTTKIVCESKFSNNGKALQEYQIVSTFLTRLSMRRVKEAISWIKDNSL